MVELQPINNTDFYLWHYLPSVPLSATSLALFLTITCIHIHLTNRHQTPFNHIFAIGGLFQVLGYAIRIVAYWHTNLIVPHVLQNCFIVLAPIFYAASVYMCLSRIVRSCGSTGEGHSIMRARWITRVFLAGDWLALNIQGNGAGLAASETERTAEIGRWIVIVGLFVQLGVFGFFVVVAGVWQRRMEKWVNEKRRTGGAEGEVEIEALPLWRRGLYLLYACSALIGVRSVFRLVEYLQGQDGYLLTTEWPLYVFDALPMLATQVVYVIWFPHQFKVETGERRKKWMRLLKRVPKQEQDVVARTARSHHGCRESQEPLTSTR